MRVLEGRGFLIRHNLDAPFSGWVSARELDGRVPLAEAPWLMLQALAELCRLLPGGLGLLWDLPGESGPRPEVAAPFFAMLGHLPGLSVHARDGGVAGHLEGPANLWLHAATAPSGPLGQAWRHGWIGWVPEAGAGWSLPGLGRAETPAEGGAEPASGWNWGEVVLPLGALKEVDPREVAAWLGDIQAGMERNLSLRISARAWPEGFSFHRRRTGWRLAVLGGREFRAAGGTWEEAAERIGSFIQTLSQALRCPVRAGCCHDPELASLLGHQAMREGHPWRYSLPLPPASPSFTPGLGADPREVSPLESRAAFPEPMAAVLAEPPVAHLRLPLPPQESAVDAFLRGRSPLPGIWWLPAEVPPPGPFSQERPWASPGAFMPLADVTQALQPGLFDALESPAAPDPGT